MFNDHSPLPIFRITSRSEACAGSVGVACKRAPGRGIRKEMTYTVVGNPPAELLAHAEALPVNADLVEFKPKGHYACYDQSAKSRDAFGLLVVASLTMKIAEGGCGQKNWLRKPR